MTQRNRILFIIIPIIFFNSIVTMNNKQESNFFLSERMGWLLSTVLRPDKPSLFNCDTIKKLRESEIHAAEKKVSRIFLSNIMQDPIIGRGELNDNCLYSQNFINYYFLFGSICPKDRGFEKITKERELQSKRSSGDQFILKYKKFVSVGGGLCIGGIFYILLSMIPKDTKVKIFKLISDSDSSNLKIFAGFAGVLSAFGIYKMIQKK